MPPKSSVEGMPAEKLGWLCISPAAALLRPAHFRLIPIWLPLDGAKTSMPSSAWAMQKPCSRLSIRVSAATSSRALDKTEPSTNSPGAERPSSNRVPEARSASSVCAQAGQDSINSEA